jgi:hypothetical protein
VTDVDLPLATTIANLQMNRPTLVLEPPPSVAACARGQEAHAEARRILGEAGLDREVGASDRETPASDCLR